MTRVYQVAALALLALAAFVMWEARKLRYWTDIGPGPGFFPFWLGLILAVLTAIWLFHVSFRPAEPMEDGFVPGRVGVLRILSVLLALVLFTGLAEVLGFQLTTLGFLLFVMVSLGSRNPLVTAAISMIGSFGVYYVFRNWLDVLLPVSSIEFLQSLGL